MWYESSKVKFRARKYERCFINHKENPSPNDSLNHNSFPARIVGETVQ